MQDVKKSSKRDGQHMSALMERAKGMLTNGATPDVVSFAEETLADIAAAVIPAIVDERLQCLPFMRWNLPQVKGAKKTKSFSFIADCMAKLVDFEGTTLKPDLSGKCDMCLKDVTKAARCCE